MSSRFPFQETFTAIRHLTKHQAITKQLQNPTSSRALAATATLFSAVGTFIGYLNMNRYHTALERRLQNIRESTGESSEEQHQWMLYDWIHKKMQMAYYGASFFLCVTGFTACFMLGRWRGAHIGEAQWQRMKSYRKLNRLKDTKLRRSLERLGMKDRLRNDKSSKHRSTEDAHINHHQSSGRLQDKDRPGYL